MREIKLLEHGLFEKKFMDSRAKTEAVSKKELILGHLIGPLGLIFVVNTIAALVEKFFTQQTGAIYGTANVAMIQEMGAHYEVVMTVAKILGIATGLLNGCLIQHTCSRQGRLRPWHLIYGFVSIAIGCLIFLFAGDTGLGESYWFFFFFLVICYNTIGSSYFYLFRDTIVSLTTRDPEEKMRIRFVRQLCWTLISGIVIGMLTSMVLLLLWLEKDINGYPILMITLSLIAIPLLLLEYFYTRERITEDVAEEVGLEYENKIPLKDQLRALLTNKYYVILTVLTMISGVVDSFKGGNVQYFYIKFLLGGAEDPLMYTIYQVITGIPLGIGAIDLPARQKDRDSEYHPDGICLCSGGKHHRLDVYRQSSDCSCRRFYPSDGNDSQCLCLCDDDLLCLRQRRAEVWLPVGGASGDSHHRNHTGSGQRALCRGIRIVDPAAGICGCGRGRPEYRGHPLYDHGVLSV